MAKDKYMDDATIFTYINDIVKNEIERVYLWCDEEDELFEKIINRLIDQNNEEINEWIWVSLVVKERSYDVNNSKLNDKAKEFVTKYINAKKHWYEISAVVRKENILDNILVNINSNIVGDRIVLKPCSIKDNCDLYLHHVEFDGDFETYVTPNDPRITPKALGINCSMPFSFYIYLKDTDEEIGNIGLRDYESNHSRMLEIAEVTYYVYKEYRHKGYAYEAMSLLIDAFFNCKLKNYIKTDRKFESIECFCKPIALKLDCNKNNIASNALAKKLGFVFSGTNYYYRIMKEVPQHENMYYLDYELYTKNIKQ